MTNLFRTLDQIEGTDLPLVGGKAYRLAILKQHRLNVPPGLVLTSRFFEAQLKYARLTPLWAGSPDVEVTGEALSWLADTLKTKPLARELNQPFNHQLDQTFEPQINNFAVRSSVIDEDQRSHTFAGIHRTELGVPRLLLPIAITRCWASALSEAAIKYRLKHGMSIQSIQIALLIQPMLTPQIAGVGFTINPLNGEPNEIIIEANWGLGESVVSSQKQPYFYKLANDPPQYPLIEQQMPNDLSSDKAKWPLSPTELTELTYRLKQVEALMGEAQDVEWAKQEGQLFLLQTRPVQVAAEGMPSLDQEWCRANYPQRLPDLPSPLFNSLLEASQRRAFIFFEQLNLDVTPLKPYIKIILGRPYLNLSLLKKAIRQAGLNAQSFYFPWGDPKGTTTNNEATEKTLSINWGRVWDKRQTYQTLFRHLRQINDMITKYQHGVAETSQQLDKAKPIDSQTDLLQPFKLHDRLYGEFFQINLILTSGISILTTLASQVIGPLSDQPAVVINQLTVADLETVDQHIEQQLLTLADQATQEPAVKNYLLNTTATKTIEATALAGTQFQADFKALLQRYHHRGPYDTDPACPRYAEEPADWLHLIQQYLQNNHPNASTNSSSTSNHWAELVQPAWSSPWRRWLVNRLLPYLRQLLTYREQLTDSLAQAMTACRQWDLQLGHSWVERGWLAQAEDIFWLTMPEIERVLLVGKNVGFTLTATIQARQETYRNYATTTLPFTLQESELPAIQFGSSSTTGDENAVMGSPVSPGQARGVVLVLQDPREFHQLADDIILVTASTSSDWLPLLESVVGLVVEVGGLLSHSSVIAREYGLPAVANIPQATQRFHTGDVVLVDGSTGIVQILEKSQHG